MIYKKISRIKPFTSQYEWEEINFPAKTKDWKMFETNSKTIDLDILFSLSKKEIETKQAQISKHSSQRENKVIFLIITDSEK